MGHTHPTRVFRHIHTGPFVSASTPTLASQKIAEEGVLPSSFYAATITLNQTQKKLPQEVLGTKAGQRCGQAIISLLDSFPSNRLPTVAIGHYRPSSQNKQDNPVIMGLRSHHTCAQKSHVAASLLLPSRRSLCSGLQDGVIQPHQFYNQLTPPPLHPHPTPTLLQPHWPFHCPVSS